jgi:hypothetical protein
MNKSIKNYLLVQQNKILDINKRIDYLIKNLDENYFESSDIKDNYIFNMDELKNSIISIDEILDNLQYNFDTVDNIELDQKIKDRIKEYDNRSKLINIFGPYILYYQIINSPLN